MCSLQTHASELLSVIAAFNMAKETLPREWLYAQLQWEVRCSIERRRIQSVAAHVTQFPDLSSRDESKVLICMSACR